MSWAPSTTTVAAAAADEVSAAIARLFGNYTKPMWHSRHNISAGYQYLQENVSTIMNSPTWNSGSKDVNLITFDEGYKTCPPESATRATTFR